MARSGKKGIKPDEVFSAGPLSVAQFGRVLLFKSDWDPKDFEKWKSMWPQLKLEAEERVREVSGRVQVFLRTKDPVEVLATLLTRHGLMDPTTYVESASRSGEHFTEYVANVATALAESELGKERLEEGEFDKLEEDLRELFEAAKASFQFGLDPAVDGELAAFRMQLVVQHLMVRGDSYPEHHEDLLRQFLEPHDAFLKDRYGFGARDLQGTLAAIDELFESRIQRSAEVGRQMHEQMERGGSREEVLERLGEEVVEDLRRELSRPPLEFLEVDRESPSINSKVIDAVSVTLGDNAEFLKGKFGGFPMGNSVVSGRPLIRIAGTTVCPSPILLSRCYFSIAANLLQVPENKDRFQKKRGELLEELATEHLQRLLPGADTHRSAYYVDLDGNRCECDALVIFDRQVFVIEAKAGAISDGTRRGAPRAVEKDFKKLIGDAFDQGARVRSRVLQGPQVRFEDERGKLLIELKRSDVDEVFIVNPTFAVVNPIGAQLGAAREMGLLKEADFWPWCIFINDLRVISEICHSPAEFLLYLKRRLLMNQTPMAAHDELDLFCKFFSDGLYFEKGEFDGLGRVLPHAFSDVLDRWYIGRPYGVQVEKPRLPVPAHLRTLIDAIEASGKERRTEAAGHLLAFGSDAMDDFEPFLLQYAAGRLQEGETHDLSVAVKDSSLGITIHVSQKGVLESNALDHAKKRRHISDFEEWLCIAYSPDTGDCNFEFIDRTARLTQDDLDHVRRIQEQLLATFVAQNRRRPGRNELCSCLSGKKFKKCCGVGLR